MSQRPFLRTCSAWLLSKVGVLWVSKGAYIGKANLKFCNTIRNNAASPVISFKFKVSLHEHDFWDNCVYMTPVYSMSSKFTQHFSKIEVLVLRNITSDLVGSSESLGWFCLELLPENIWKSEIWMSESEFSEARENKGEEFDFECEVRRDPAEFRIETQWLCRRPLS